MSRMLIFKNRFYNQHQYLVQKILFLLLICAMEMVTTAAAQNLTRPNIEGPSGLQVNSYTGSLFYKRTDLLIPGRGLSLETTFSYNSSDRTVNYGFGYGWTFNYNELYKDTSDGVVFYRGDGRKDYYKASGNNYTAPRGIFDILTKYESNKYRLAGKNGTEYFFENPANKKLTRIRERNGNEITLSYSGNNLAAVTDASGRTVNFTWANNLLQKVTISLASLSKSIQYSYNSTGCLSLVRDPAGNTIAYAYGAGRILNSVTDGNGNLSTVSYNSNNAVVRLASCLMEKNISYNAEQKKVYLIENAGSKSLFTTYEFDGEGRLISRTGNCCGFKNAYSYDGDNNISRITDANGGATLYGYDIKGNLVSETDPLGKTIRYTYENTFNQVASITDKAGNKTLFAYDDHGNLLETDYPLNISLKYTYDNNGNRTSFTDGRNNKTTYGYDEYGYLSTATNPAGGTSNFLHDAWGNVLTNTDANGHTTVYKYDGSDQLSTRTDAAGFITKYAYDANGNRVSVTDANGNTTRYYYDANNKPINITNALGFTTVMSYDGFGNMVAGTDASGHATNYTFDNFHRLTSSTNAAGEQTSYEHDGNGNVVTVTYPNGNHVNVVYDAMNRVSRLADNLGTIATYTYDANSNKLGETNGAGNATTYNYDALNRLVAKTDPLGNTYNYLYDANSNVVKETDRNGNGTLYTYDLLNQPLSMIDAQGNITLYAYDKEGNQLSVTDANGNKTQYAYDALDRKTEERFADNTTKGFAYDRAGNLVSRKDNGGQVTQYNYDALNRMIARAYPNVTESFTYDAVGRMLSAKNGNANVQFTYDVTGRITSETLNGTTTGYTYNIAAGLKTITYPGGRLITRVMDGRNQLTGIKEGAAMLAAFDYNQAGQNTGRKYSNNTTTSLAYNGRGQLTDLNFSASHVSDVNYVYDNEGNPTAANYRNQPARSESYAHDKLNQLTTFSKGSTQSSFVYDAVGNRKTAQIQGATASYAVNNMNAYTSILYGSTISPTYDLNGNETADGRNNYTYDFENRIISVNAGATATYKYDALGRRISKIVGSDTTSYYFDGHQIIEERLATNVVATYVWGTWIDDLISMNRNGKAYYYNSNNIGSVTSITDEKGALVERYEYDAYGKAFIYSSSSTLIAASAIGNSYMFSGRQYEAETGLYFYRARFYDAVHGRFLQRDPLGYVDGLVSYSYVNNSPIDRSDPSGLSWIDKFLDDHIDNEFLNYYADADLTWLRPINNFLAGYSDELTFGLTNFLRDIIGTNGTVDKCSNLTKYGEWFGTAYSLAYGLKLGISGATKGPGEVFSHYVPSRFINPKSPSYLWWLDNNFGQWLIKGKNIWNGNYVSRLRHYLHDDYATLKGVTKIIDNTSKPWLKYIPKWNPILQQLDRIPNTIKGIFLGGAAGYEQSKSPNYCNCNN